MSDVSKVSAFYYGDKVFIIYINEVRTGASRA